VFVFIIFVWRSFFHRSVSNGTGEGGNFEEKHRKIICFVWKKDFSALWMFFSSPRICFVFFLVILILSFLDDVFSLFSNVTIHSFWMQKIESHSLYIWISFEMKFSFFFGLIFDCETISFTIIFFFTFILFIVYKKLFCHKYIHTAYYITSEHLSEYIKNTHGYRYHAKVQQNTCFSQLENLLKSYVLEIQLPSMWVNITYV